MRFKSGFIGLGLLSIVQAGVAATELDSIRVIVKYKKQPLALSSVKAQISDITQLNVSAMHPMANGAYSIILNGKNSSLLSLDQEKMGAMVLEQLRQNPDVLYAVKDRTGHFKPVPDPVAMPLTNILSHESQWDEFSRPAGIMLESAPGLKDGAWAYSTGKSKAPVVVAVLDTGIEYNDSLINSLVKDDKGRVFGWNFSANNNDLSDQTRSYHGTHVSGTVAGYGQVMTGVGEDLKILTLKIPDRSGLFYESAVVNAIYWAVGGEVPGVPVNPYPAKVLNMSFGVDIERGKEADYCDQALQEAINFARKKGAVIIVAAGNDNLWEHYNAPGVCNGTVKVAATGPKGFRSYFSNYGPSVTLAAPGGDKRYGLAAGILSTVKAGLGCNYSGFDFYQGTSMAAPHVSGVAGLVLAASSKELKPEQVEQILYVTTHDFGKSDDDEKSCVGKKPCGHGILDAEYAVKTVLADYDVLFSAPKVDHLHTVACGQSRVKPSKKALVAEGVQWVQKNSACVDAADYQNPHVQLEKDGKIHAYYGVVEYELDQTAYKACDVVGYDGVGCHW